MHSLSEEEIVRSNTASLADECIVCVEISCSRRGWSPLSAVDGVSGICLRTSDFITADNVLADSHRDQRGEKCIARNHVHLIYLQWPRPFIDFISAAQEMEAY